MRPDQAFITTRKGGTGERVTVFVCEDGIYEAVENGTRKIAQSVPPIGIESYLEKSFERPFTPYEGEIGVYHRRINRNINNEFHLNHEADEKAFHGTLVVLRRLLTDLEEIYQFIEPEPENYNVYGYVLREHLMHACTEVEASWTGILRANEYAGSGYWTTRDYFKLRDPMRLHEYSARLIFKPESRFAPFENWANENGLGPTETIPWYDAYNESKHDREANLDKASLVMATQATAAFFILAHAQFRTRGILVDPKVFTLESQPEFPAEQKYRYPPKGDKWSWGSKALFGPEK